MNYFNALRMRALGLIFSPTGYIAIQRKTYIEIEHVVEMRLSAKMRKSLFAWPLRVQNPRRSQMAPVELDQ